MAIQEYSNKKPRMHKPPTHLSSVLKENRKKAGLTQKKMGALVGVSEKAVKEIEQGREEHVNFGTMKKIFAYFGLTLVALRDTSIIEPKAGILDGMDLINRLKSIKKAVEIPFGIESIKLFGSYSRGEAREDSDIDILISTKNSLGLKEITILEKIFELGLDAKKIDLVLDNEMKKEIRDSAEKDMIDV